MQNCFFFLDKNLIPNDASVEILNKFLENATDSSLETCVYPDIHYKKGAPIVNGLLTSSKEYIYPSMLGVANCGFSFGDISCEKNPATERPEHNLEKVILEFSKDLPAYESKIDVQVDKLKELLAKELFSHHNSKSDYAEVLNYLNIKSLEQAKKLVDSSLTSNMLNAGKKSICTLGGGNHFFEVYKKNDLAYNNPASSEYFYILHSDSVALGDKVNLMYSNLSELHHYKGFTLFTKIVINRLRQLFYFTLKKPAFIMSPVQTIKLLFSKSNSRGIKLDSYLGKSLLGAFTVAAIFGELNRSHIISLFSKVTNEKSKEFKVSPMGSNSHDSIFLEKHQGELRLTQRNGVQRIQNQEFFVVPGALGTKSYILKNLHNEKAYFSANHGAGRLLDKHLAKKSFTPEETLEQLKKANIKIVRIGKGRIEEQNLNAFKNIDQVLNTMSDNKLGTPAFELEPLFSVKA